jgi:F-type H+-transporting ATPase subunit delta
LPVSRSSTTPWRTSAQTIRLVDYVVQAGRSRDIVGTLDWLVERTAEARGWRVARVRSALEIDDAQRERLADSLARLTGNPVELQVTLEPTLLGGAVVQVGNIQIDASAEGRLENFREHLAPGGWDVRFAGDGTTGTRTRPGQTGTRGES